MTRAQSTSVTPDQVSEIVTQEVSAQFRHWSGPLPSPDSLREFNEVVPGSASKIVDAFVEQGNHRRQLERQLVVGTERRADLGQRLVFTFLVLVVVLGGVVALAENGAAGALIITAGLGSGVALYILGGRTPHEE